jgi:hypothetical protein
LFIDKHVDINNDFFMPEYNAQTTFLQGATTPSASRVFSTTRGVQAHQHNQDLPEVQHECVLAMRRVFDCMNRLFSY